MAILNRVLDFFNGDMGPVERPRFQPPMNPQPYVDDIFDPLFNRDVVSYNRDLYGTLGAIPAGYAQMWENALTGREGILGPGMGILSTFGRSMDKADDFILGGLTEGVNAVGRLTGTNDAPSNPIRNIFVEDQDYEGSDLLAAMGNAMGKMAGGVRLDRGDFDNLPDRMQSSIVNLATDPGFMGGNIARLNPANRVAKALDDYDNAMAAVAGNVTLPGAKLAAQRGLKGLVDLVGGTMNRPYMDYRFTDDADAQRQISDMMASYADVGGTDHLTDDEFAVYRAWAPSVPNAYATDLTDVTDAFGNPDEMLDAFETSRNLAYGRMFKGIGNESPVYKRDSEIAAANRDNVRLPERFTNDAGDFLNEDAGGFLDEVAEKLRSQYEKNPNSPRFANDDLQRFLDDYDYSVGQLGDSDANAALLEQLQNLYDYDPATARLVDDVLDVRTPYVNREGAAYLTVSDADSRRATADDYSAIRQSIVYDAARTLSDGAKHGASKAEDAVLNALSDYTRGSEDVVLSLKYGKETTGNALRNLTWHTLKNPSSTTLPFEILDSFNRIVEANPKTPYRSALRSAFEATNAFSKSFTSGRFDYDEVSKGYRDFLNSLGANLPDNARFDKCAKWYSENKPFVDAVRRIMEQPKEDLARNLKGIMDGLPNDVRSRVLEWFRYAEGKTPKGFLNRMSSIADSSVQNVKLKNEGYLTRWYESKATIEGRERALREALAYASGDRKAGIQAQLDDIDTLQRFMDRLERLERNTSTTFPKYLRDVNPDEIQYYVSPRGLLEQSTTSTRIGDDTKSLMDWLDANPSKESTLPLQWTLRPNRRVLANDFDKDGWHVRPEAQFLSTVAKGESATVEEWRHVLRPTTEFNPSRNYAFFKGSKFQLTPDGEIMDLVVRNDKGFRFNPALTPENAIHARFRLEGNNGRTGDALRGIRIENGNVYITSNDAFNYFTRHVDDHRPIPYDKAIKQRYANVVDWTPAETASLATDPPHMGDVDFYGMSDELTAPIAKNWNVDRLDPLDPDDVTFVKRVGSPKEQSLFAYLARMAVGVRNSKVIKKRHGFLNAKTLRVMNLAKQVKAKYSAEDIAEYIRQRDAASDAIVKAEDFVGSLVNSEGFKIAAVTGAESKDLRNVLTSNVDKVNAAAGENILKVVYSKGGNGEPDFVGYAFNDMDPKIKRHLDEYVRKVNPEGIGLSDVTFHRGTGSYGQGLTKEMVRDLDAVFDETTSLLNEYTKRFGFTEFDGNYVRHDLTDDLYNKFGFMAHKSKLGVVEARNIANALSDVREFDRRMHRVLGTKAFDRSWYGDMSYYKDGFSTDVEAIVKDTFTKGALDNANASLAQELFFNGNFTLKNNFADPRQIMDALRQEGSSNMTNLQIVVPKFNDEGVLTGFTRVDSYDDAGILKAFDDDNAILVPKSVFGRLDRILKKEAKMSNGIYRFAQKYLTVPFKLGVISNLGFLFGNVQDASFKQVESFMRRYNTSFDDECFNAAASYKHAVDMQNRFSDVVDNYVKFLNGGGIDRRMYKNALASIKKTGTVDPALITSNPHYLDEFTTWLSSRSKEEGDAAKLYLFAHSIMDAGTFENNYLDLEDLTQAGNKEAANRFDIPLNAADRVLYGDRSAGERNFSLGPLKGNRLVKPGLVTNPATNAVLKPSNAWEHTTRLATVLNYMRHEGWTDKQITETLGLAFDDAKLQKLRVDMLQGVDMMNHANFDYDDVTGFMDKISYAVPFPTFYLKNVAHWMEVFADHPQMVDDIVSFQEGLWQNKDVKDDEFVAEAKGRGAYPIGGRTPFGTGIVKQSPINSMFSAFSAVNNFKEDFAYRTHPMARPLTRHLQKPEDVKYRPYSTDPYEKNIKQGDRNFSELAYMFHQLNPYDRYLNTYLRTPRKVATNDYQASDFLPSVFQPDFGKKRH